MILMCGVVKKCNIQRQKKFYQVICSNKCLQLQSEWMLIAWKFKRFHFHITYLPVELKVLMVADFELKACHV